MTAGTICLYNKFGFCKHGENCHKEHVEETCKLENCSVVDCRNRHPKNCRYYWLSKRCKFGDYCAFSHYIPTDPVLVEMKIVKEHVKTLEEEVKENNDEIKSILRNIERSLISLNLPKTVPSTHSTVTLPNIALTSQSTIAIVTSNLANNLTSSHSTEISIPQLDCSIQSSFSLSEIKCENCGKNFESEKMLTVHTDKHRWGCDDYFLCFTTKCAADLHELEYHGDSPESLGYIRDHVSESAKQMFAAGHRQR